MRAVIQRVSEAGVRVDNCDISRIGNGILVLLGVGVSDSEVDAAYLAEKIVNLRMFEDEDGKLNRSLAETGGEMLVVSQFTLYGDCRKGRRPSFTQAAPPERAEALYRHFVRRVEAGGVKVQTGRFRTRMAVALVNDGPVTLIIESPA
jgi:D-tyrosyl-tRNA(Tyr) deacylase